MLSELISYHFHLHSPEFTERLQSYYEFIRLTKVGR